MCLRRASVVDPVALRCGLSLTFIATDHSSPAMQEQTMGLRRTDFYIEQLPSRNNAQVFARNLGCHDTAYVDVEAAEWCKPQICLDNVCTAVQLFGGEGRLGYLLWENWGGLCLTAEPHCIWFVDGKYREITPQYGRANVCFLWSEECLHSFEDFEKSQHILIGRRAEAKPLVQHPLVEQAISTMTEISERAWEIANAQGIEESHRYHDSRIGEVRTLVEQFHSIADQKRQRVQKKTDRLRKKAERRRRKTNRR